MKKLVKYGFAFAPFAGVVGYGHGYGHGHATSHSSSKKKKKGGLIHCSQYYSGWDGQLEDFLFRVR